MKHRVILSPLKATVRVSGCTTLKSAWNRVQPLACVPRTSAVITSTVSVSRPSGWGPLSTCFSFLVHPFSMPVISSPTHTGCYVGMDNLSTIWELGMLTIHSHDKAQIHVMQWERQIRKTLTVPFKSPRSRSGHSSSLLLDPVPGVRDLIPSLAVAGFSYFPSSLWDMVPSSGACGTTTVDFWLRLHHLHQNSMGHLLKCRFLDHVCLTSFLNCYHRS